MISICLVQVCSNGKILLRRILTTCIGEMANLPMEKEMMKQLMNRTPNKSNLKPGGVAIRSFLSGGDVFGSMFYLVSIIFLNI